MKSFIISLVILSLGWSTGPDLNHEKNALEHNQLNKVHSFQKSIDQELLTSINHPEKGTEYKAAGSVNQELGNVEVKEEAEVKEDVEKLETIDAQDSVEPQKNKESNTNNNQVEKGNRDEGNESPSKDELINLANTFMNELFGPVQDGKVKEFDSKKELIHYLKNYATEDFSTGYVDTFFEEKDGGLYVIPMCGPIWITDNQPFTLKKVNDQTYQLSQKNSTDMYGNYTIHLTFKKASGSWIISSKEVQY